MEDSETSISDTALLPGGVGGMPEGMPLQEAIKNCRAKRAEPLARRSQLKIAAQQFITGPKVLL